jgi:hypothetical protein
VRVAVVAAVLLIRPLVLEAQVEVVRAVLIR